MTTKMGFSEALDVLQQGGRVKRASWDENRVIELRHGGIWSVSDGVFPFNGLPICDILAEDWEIAAIDPLFHHPV